MEWRQVSVWRGLVLGWLVLLVGCATGSSAVRPMHPAGRMEVRGSAGGFPSRIEDAFQVMQWACGLEEDVRHPMGAALYVTQARELLGHLARTRVTVGNGAPRQALTWMLEEVLEGGARVEYNDLRWRAERFWRVVWVRPDGYLVAAHDGTPLQRWGELRLEEGEWRVGSLAVGGFYFSQGGVFYPATEALREVPHEGRADPALVREWRRIPGIDGTGKEAIEPG